MPAKKKEPELVKKARLELGLMTDNKSLIDEYLKVVKAFCEFKHTDDSVTVVVPILNSLFLSKNITPLTDSADEWVYFDTISSGVELLQNVRNPQAFSTDGGKTYYLLSEGAHHYNQRPNHGTVRKEQ